MSNWINKYCLDGIVLPQTSSAQVDPPHDPVDAPIDGGLSVLFGTGVVYGIKKVKERRKKQREDQNNL